jgi:hypothetical protein
MHRADCLPQQIDWCRDQQRSALKHMRPVVASIGHGASLAPHTCDHPQCLPENNERWMLDSVAEELEIMYGDPSRMGT